MKDKLRNLFEEMKVRSRYKPMWEIINMIEPLVDQEVERRIAETIAGKFIEVEIEKRIKERMLSKDEIIKYFNNHFDCHAEVIIGLYETTEIAMTESAVLKMFEMLRSRLTNPE